MPVNLVLNEPTLGSGSKRFKLNVLQDSSMRMRFACSYAWNQEDAGCIHKNEVLKDFGSASKKVRTPSRFQEKSINVTPMASDGKMNIRPLYLQV